MERRCGVFGVLVETSTTTMVAEARSMRVAVSLGGGGWEILDCVAVFMNINICNVDISKFHG